MMQARCKGKVLRCWDRLGGKRCSFLMPPGGGGNLHAAKDFALGPSLIF